MNKKLLILLGFLIAQPARAQNGIVPEIRQTGQFFDRKVVGEEMFNSSLPDNFRGRLEAPQPAEAPEPANSRRERQQARQFRVSSLYSESR